MDSEMITCIIRYTIDPYKIAQFEYYARLWIRLVNNLGGRHDGYFLPQEGANDVAFSMFSFPSLSAYESYRKKAAGSSQCNEAMKYAEETRCILRSERSFYRHIL